VSSKGIDAPVAKEMI